MLEVILAKVAHAKEKEAKKIISLVRSADIFSPEEACCDPYRATHDEKMWERILGDQNMTQSKFKKLLEDSKEKKQAKTHPI